MSNDLVRDGYNQAAESYTSQRNQFESNQYLEYLVELLPVGSSVLDIGCGAGIPIDKFLVDRGYKVLGIDISQKQIELAKKNVSKATYTIKDMSDLQTGEYQVDAIVSFYAIFHTPRPQHEELFKKINTYLP